MAVRIFAKAASSHGRRLSETWPSGSASNLVGSRRVDLRLAVEFISRDSPEAAARFGHAAVEVARSLAELSERGRVVPELGDQVVREILLARYRIVYEVFADRCCSRSSLQSRLPRGLGSQVDGSVRATSNAVLPESPSRHWTGGFGIANQATAFQSGQVATRSSPSPMSKLSPVLPRRFSTLISFASKWMTPGGSTRRRRTGRWASLPARWTGVD